MSALAQPVVDVAAGDRLARRNALVLAVTQALAGGNSTVLVATAGIVGTMLAPDKSLVTLPISIYVLGMWMGTLPIGALAAAPGPARRAADRHRLRGAHRMDLLSRRAARLVSPLQCRRRVQRPIRLGPPVLSLRCRRYRQRGVPAEGDRMGALWRGRCRRYRRPTRHRDPGSVAALSLRRDLSRPVSPRPDLGWRVDVLERSEAAAALGCG